MFDLFILFLGCFSPIQWINKMLSPSFPLNSSYIEQPKSFPQVLDSNLPKPLLKRHSNLLKINPNAIMKQNPGLRHVDSQYFDYDDIGKNIRLEYDKELSERVLRLPYRLADQQPIEYGAYESSHPETFIFEEDTIKLIWWMKLFPNFSCNSTIVRIFRIIDPKKNQIDPFISLYIMKSGSEEFLLCSYFGMVKSLGLLKSYLDKWINVSITFNFKTQFQIKLNSRDETIKSNAIFEPTRKIQFPSSTKFLIPKWGINAETSFCSNDQILKYLFLFDVHMFKKSIDLRDSTICNASCIINKDQRFSEGSYFPSDSRNPKSSKKCRVDCHQKDCQVSKWIKGSCYKKNLDRDTLGRRICNRMVRVPSVGFGVDCTMELEKEEKCKVIGPIQEPIIDPLCHPQAVYKTSVSECQCVNNMQGDGRKNCGCPNESKQISSQCVPLYTFHYKVDGELFSLMEKTVFPMDKDPYEIFLEKPYYNKVEESSVHNVKHLSIVNDTSIDSSVLRIVMHKDLDGDGADRENTERQRTEVKGSHLSDPTILGYRNETLIYIWWFKLNGDIKVGEKFCHIFQLKAVGNDVSTPIFTFSLKNNIRKKDVFYFGYYKKATELGELRKFVGKWIQAYVEVKYCSFNGYIKFDLRDINGERLISTKTNEFDVPNATNNYGDYQFVRPKWGIYRSRLNSNIFNNEDFLLLTDLSIYKKKEISPFNLNSLDPS